MAVTPACQRGPEPIVAYNVDKVATSPAHGSAPGRELVPGKADTERTSRDGKDRMLAAMVLRPSQAWFFKMVGPKDAVAGQADAFRQLLASLKLDSSDDPPKWKTPKGWRQEPGDEISFAVLRIDGQDKIKVTVTVLPKRPGDDESYVLLNLNRWRRQMKLAPLEAAGKLERVGFEGGEALVVDLVGTVSSNMTAPFFSGAKQ